MVIWLAGQDRLLLDWEAIFEHGAKETELPGHVSLHRVPKAAHTQSWNVAPRLYERRLRAFLERPSVAGANSP